MAACSHGSDLRRPLRALSVDGDAKVIVRSRPQREVRFGYRFERQAGPARVGLVLLAVLLIAGVLATLRYERPAPGRRWEFWVFLAAFAAFSAGSAMAAEVRPGRVVITA
jgi:hypothetical protein